MKTKMKWSKKTLTILFLGLGSVFSIAAIAIVIPRLNEERAIVTNLNTIQTQQQKFENSRTSEAFIPEFYVIPKLSLFNPADNLVDSSVSKATANYEIVTLPNSLIERLQRTDANAYALAITSLNAKPNTNNQMIASISIKRAGKTRTVNVEVSQSAASTPGDISGTAEWRNPAIYKV